MLIVPCNSNRLDANPSFDAVESRPQNVTEVFEHCTKRSNIGSATRLPIRRVPAVVVFQLLSFALSVVPFSGVT